MFCLISSFVVIRLLLMYMSHQLRSKVLSYTVNRNFRENFFFANGVKIQICGVNNSRLENDILTPGP